MISTFTLLFTSVCTCTHTVPSPVCIFSYFVVFSSALQQKQDFSSSSSSHARSNTSCSSGNSKVNGAEGLKREKEVASVSAFFGSTPVKRVSKSSQSLSEAHPVDNENKLTKVL